jgi:hypothetical protein
MAHHGVILRRGGTVSRTVGDEDLSHSAMLISLRPTERGYAATGPAIELRPVYNQQLDDVCVATIGGLVQGRIAVVDSGVDISPAGNELRDDSLLTMIRGPVQRCVAVQPPFVYICTAIDEVGDTPSLVCPGSIQ